jgi:predicted amidophosphoribosyltransferase
LNLLDKKNFWRELLPPCENCQNPSRSLFCEDCFEILRFHNACLDCGHSPLISKESICLECSLKSKPWNNTYCSFIYEAGVKSWIQDIKDNYRVERFKELCLEQLPNFKNKYDVLIPLSSDPTNIQKRQFDVAEKLASHLSRLLNISVYKGAFKRLPFLQSQRKLSGKLRQTYLQQTLSLAMPGGISWERALLVDDVMTTGASLRVHAELLAPRAQILDVYCLARALKN